MEKQLPVDTPGDMSQLHALRDMYEAGLRRKLEVDDMIFGIENTQLRDCDHQSVRLLALKRESAELGAWITTVDGRRTGLVVKTVLSPAE